MLYLLIKKKLIQSLLYEVSSPHNLFQPSTSDQKNWMDTKKRKDFYNLVPRPGKEVCSATDNDFWRKVDGCSNFVKTQLDKTSGFGTPKSYESTNEKLGINILHKLMQLMHVHFSIPTIEIKIRSLQSEK